MPAVFECALWNYLYFWKVDPGYLVLKQVRLTSVEERRFNIFSVSDCSVKLQLRKRKQCCQLWILLRSLLQTEPFLKLSRCSNFCFRWQPKFLEVNIIFFLNQFLSSSIFYSIIYYHARNHWIKETNKERKMFFVLSRGRDKEKILSPREESNLRTSESAFRCSTTETPRWARSITKFILLNFFTARDI